MSSSAPSPTPTSWSCGSQLYNIPVQDAACGVPAIDNSTDIMVACCGNVDVVSYYDGCGLYCLAAGQSVGDLSQCIQDKGLFPGYVFCTQSSNATATDTGAPLPTSANATVVASHGSTASPTKSGGNSDSTSTETPGAAAGLRPEYTTVGTLGATIVALLFSATAFGAFQL
ncbi:uncharacterized protein F4812DRAFT_463820 [Daldinia caldariorum]|uniref:uncharacterized protein n=1 Tax=Daldinia caldariorum TaxID=326644 RepID=UPI0020082F34|nr:uncharacterized protein F4812DRAFT_463820 [Daldinia caldariorum]KAI1463284.1 hypothetical protein F4812DRAFT_463820 [Daldinia caldariorum]